MQGVTKVSTVSEGVAGVQNHSPTRGTFPATASPHGLSEHHVQMRAASCVLDADTLRRRSFCWRLWRLRKPLDPPRAADHGDFRGEGAAAGLSTARAAGARADGGSLA